jgi:hypothetical protein
MLGLDAKDDRSLIDAGLINSDLGMLRTRGTRTWIGLTEEDLRELAKAQHGWEDLLISAEAKLKEKNDGSV